MSITKAWNELKLAIEKLENENKTLHEEIRKLKGLDIIENITSQEAIIKKDQNLIQTTVNKLAANITKPINKNALVILALDTSGSMGRFEKFMAKSYFTWVVEILKRKYKTVEVKYIIHHTEAKIVDDEEEFYNKGESGGTIVSLAYKEISKLIEDYDYENSVDVYAFHGSDGDNLTSDNERSLKVVNRILDKVKQFNYFEINPYLRQSTLSHIFKNINKDNFKYSVVVEEKDVYTSVQKFVESL